MLRLNAVTEENATWDIPKYCIYSKPARGLYLTSDSKKELRLKIAIAGLTIGKCIEKPAEFKGIHQFRYAVFEVHDLRPKRYEQEKQ